MRELEAISAVQDYGNVPAERSSTLDGASRLLRLAGLAEELEAEPIAEEARELAARVAEGRFYVACVGQFKRGKSTLLNALVGHEVVPTGYVPVTAVPTVIRFGDALRARVRMLAGCQLRLPAQDCSDACGRSVCSERNCRTLPHGSSIVDSCALRTSNSAASSWRNGRRAAGTKRVRGRATPARRS